METIKGIPVSPGISIAEVALLRSDNLRIHRRFVGPEDVESEVRRFEQAARKASRDLEVQIADLGEELMIAAPVLQTHRDMLNDPGLHSDVISRIRDNQFTAAYASSIVLGEYHDRFEQMESEYLSERSHDIRDIERQLLTRILGKRRRPRVFRENVTVVAHNLTPSQTASMAKEMVVGFAVDVGGRTSHTAILARALQVPAVVGLKDVSRKVVNGDILVIDGYTGEVIVNPDKKTLASYRRKARYSEKFYSQLQEEISWPAETIDGHEITLSANIELHEEVATALEWGAKGIGLYRTEFLYDQGFPDEDLHFKAYRKAVKALRGRELVIRTLDAGADKFHEEFVGFEEPNPFLGCRSIRLCLQEQGMFRSQIRAALRVSVFGPVKIMLPMISTIEELRSAKSIIAEVREELEAEGAEMAPRVPVGIMVEVPSIALIIDRVADEVDFFSIGTNDLVQYSLAVDRVNEHVAHLYQPSHPGILRLIGEVIVASNRAGIQVSICGEMCSEPAYVLLLMGLGLRHFSLSPIAIPTVKRIIRQVTMKEAVEVAEQCLGAEQSSESEEFLAERTSKLLPDFF
ncbi:MAG: phosphoenolpyruvate--protein phosphotransferase [Planctomycetota bacterium]|nr:phosphoenolpyruvate--protein phosphotransferase [Planctomycetota bacterium]